MTRNPLKAADPTEGSHRLWKMAMTEWNKRSSRENSCQVGDTKPLEARLWFPQQKSVCGGGAGRQEGGLPGAEAGRAMTVSSHVHRLLRIQVQVRVSSPTTLPVLVCSCSDHVKTPLWGRERRLCPRSLHFLRELRFFKVSCFSQVPGGKC